MSDGVRKLRRDQAGFRRFFAYLEETGLDEPLREICRAHRTTLFETYADARTGTAVAARLECWSWLALEIGKSPGEIARIFDREQASIRYGLGRMREAAAGDGAGFGRETLRALAGKVAARSAAAMAAGGRRAGVRRRPARSPQDGLSASGAGNDPVSDPERS